MKKGFSLIELMIVIIILGLLASFVLPSLVGKSEDAKEKLTCVQMKSVAQSIKLFKIDNGRLPTTTEGLNILIQKSDETLNNYASKGYFEDKKLPLDPWGHQYVYINSNDTFDLLSFGANGTEGGDDDILLSTCK